MQIKEFVKFFEGSDRIMIVRGEQKWTGWCSVINGQYGLLKDLGLTGKEEVVGFKIHIDMYHPEWKELGLRKPIAPDEAADYRFSDLCFHLYRVIFLEAKK